MTTKHKTILIVDDDPNIRTVVRFALRKAGFETHEASDGLQAIDQTRAVRPDLIVLDIMMPEMDGTDVCRELRTFTNTPIVFLSSRDDELDRVLGLEMGGDDYVTKPFSPRELVARIKAVLRRTSSPTPREPQPKQPTHNLYTHGNLTLDTTRFQVWWASTPVILTVTEFALLKALIQHPGRVFSRESLIQHAYGPSTYVTDRTIDSHVRRVRQKFSRAGGQPIETVHGVGYKLGSCD